MMIAMLMIMVIIWGHWGDIEWGDGDGIEGDNDDNCNDHDDDDDGDYLGTLGDIEVG